jgi:hypothetical protein
MICLCEIDCFDFLRKVMQKTTPVLLWDKAKWKVLAIVPFLSVLATMSPGVTIVTGPLSCTP